MSSSEERNHSDHRQVTISISHTYTGKSVQHRLHACVFDTARPPFGSINFELLVTGGRTCESLVAPAQREEGLLQPEAAQQN